MDQFLLVFGFTYSYNFLYIERDNRNDRKELEHLLGEI